MTAGRHTYADIELARRIEREGVSDTFGYVQASIRTGIYPDAAAVKVAGGVAAYFSPGNVMNGSLGLGMHGPVEREEVAALVAFFDEREEPASVDVCPLADPSLAHWLAEYRFSADSFEHVLYQPLPRTIAAPAAGVEVRLALSAEERETWAALEARGFTEDAATEADFQLARAIAARKDALHFIGYLDGVPAGTGMLYVERGLARFNGDATLPEMRNRGVQTAVLAERLAYASRAGCDLAAIEACPGSASQRNQERAGFRIAYTRVSLVRAVPG